MRKPAGVVAMPVYNPDLGGIENLVSPNDAAKFCQAALLMMGDRMAAFSKEHKLAAAFVADLLKEPPHTYWDNELWEPRWKQLSSLLLHLGYPHTLVWATVPHEKDKGGEIVLVLSPAHGKRFRRLQAEFEAAGPQPNPATYQPGAEPPHPAGQLWLRPPGSLWCPEPFQLAVDCFPSQTQGARNDNKLVLGYAGTGRGILLGRLTKAAHAAGNCVVAFTQERTGAVAAVGEVAGGGSYTIRKLADASCNPFWFPELELAEGSRKMPSEQQLISLMKLLANLLTITAQTRKIASPLDSVLLEKYLLEELSEYYTYRTWLYRLGYQGPAVSLGRRGKRTPQQELDWPSLGRPGFNSFCYAVSNGEHFFEEKPDEYYVFIRWFDKVSTPFYLGGELEALVNGRAEQVGALVGIRSRFMRITLSESLSESVTGEDAIQCAWLLLLHTFDTHLGHRERRLTIVLDELPAQAVGASVQEYLTRYLADWRQVNRDLLVSWRGAPDQLFNEAAPVAQLLLEACDTQLMTAYPKKLWQEAQRKNKALLLSPQTERRLRSLRAGESEGNRFTQRDILVRIPATSDGQIFEAGLQDAALDPFLTAWEIYQRVMVQRAKAAVPTA